MIARLTATLTALGAIAGCVSYSGGARALDPARLATEPGWIVAAPTPQLRQAGPRDCGATALAMVAGRWRVPLSIEQLVAALPAPTPQGARLGDLRDVARAHGLIAFAIAGDRATLVHELHAGRPVIVGLRLPYGRRRVQSHYEVIVAVHPADGRFATIDPAGGWRSRTWAELDAEWGPVGRPTLIVLGPTRSIQATTALAGSSVVRKLHSMRAVRRLRSTSLNERSRSCVSQISRHSWSPPRL